MKKRMVVLMASAAMMMLSGMTVSASENLDNAALLSAALLFLHFDSILIPPPWQDNPVYILVLE